MDMALGYPRGFYVFLGRGDGTFLPAPNSPNRSSSISGKLTVADFNQDGKPDLLTDIGNTVEFYLGAGDGSFGNTLTNQLVDRSISTLPFDFNSDGIVDIAFLGSTGVTGLIGVGGASFQAASLIAPLSPLNFRQDSSKLAFGDFDGDGIVDTATLATYNEFGISSVRIVVSFRGTGKSAVLRSSTNAMIVDDLNRDGNDDIVVQSENGDIGVFLSGGNGTFGESVIPFYPNNIQAFPKLFPGSLSICDFNGDGHLDIASSRRSTQSLCTNFFANCQILPPQPSIGILLGDGKGGFSSTDLRIVDGIQANDIKFADFNQDGLTDMLAVSPVQLFLGTNPTSLRTESAASAIQSTRASTNFATALRVVARDADQTPLAGVPVRFFGSTQFGPGAIILPNLNEQTVLTGLDGIASVQVRANAVAGGPYNFTAEASGLTPVVFSLTNTPGTTATNLTVTPSTTTAVAGQSIRFDVTVSPTAATGQLIVRSGSNTLATAALTLGGVGSVSFSLPAGNNALIFEYSGDAIHNRSLTSLSVAVNAAASTPTIQSATSVVNGASLRDGLASGTWITIYGSNLSTTTRLWGAEDFDGNRLPTTLDGVRVTINGRAASVYFISPNQLNILAPNDPTTGPVPIQVTTSNGVSNTVMVNKQAVAPALFTYSLQQGRYAIAQDGTSFALVAPEGFFGTAASTRPARPGQILTFYATGLGDTDPSYPNGEIPAPAALRVAPKVSIGGVEATVAFAGLVGAGLYQLNVQVPNLPPGDARIVISIGDINSPVGVFLPIE